MTADLGRFPRGFKHLRFLEQIIMSKMIMFGHVNKMGCTTASGKGTPGAPKLFGHMLALPLSRVEIRESQEDELPRRHFVKYAARICFIGEDGLLRNAARQLTKQHGVYDINIQRLKDWMTFMGQEEELARLTNHEAEYKKTWDDEIEELHKMTCFGDTETFSVLNKRASSNVSKMFEGDDATQQGATGEFERYVLNPPATPVKHSRRARLTWIKELVNTEDVEEGGEDEGEQEVGDMEIKAGLSWKTLRNEFRELDRIIYDGFRCLYPLGHDTKVFGGCKSVRKSAMQRMLRFYDQRFAHNTNFLFYMFSQEMRHDACREVAKVKSSARMERFREIINEATFERRLEYAIKHPESTQAIDTARLKRAVINGSANSCALICEREVSSQMQSHFVKHFGQFNHHSFESRCMDKLLEGFVQYPGQKIGWSAQERGNVKTKMYAMMQVYGPASWFITVSPPMCDSWLAQKLMQRQTCDMTADGRDFEEWKPTKDLARRKALGVKNPVECARVYNSFSLVFDTPE
jgi:hypothetical protein